MQTFRKLGVFILLAQPGISLGVSAEEDSLHLFPGLPGCALDCLVAAVPGSSCSASNVTCLCIDKALQADVTACVTNNCTIKESLVAQNATMTSCKAPVRDASPNYKTLCIAFTTIPAAFVIQRLAVKIYWKLGLGLDDLFIFLSMSIQVPNLALNLGGVVPAGLGRDIWTVTPTSIMIFNRFFYVLGILYFVQLTLLKFALLFFYLRIFCTNPVRRILWATIIFNGVFGFVFTVVAIFQCRPIRYFWLKWDGEHQGYCANINTLTWANAVIGIAIDIWMLAVPLLQVKKLHLDWKKKIGVALMFSVGTFVTIVSILRLRSLVKFRSTSKNPTWEFIEVTKWSAIEIGVGIICACMPSFRMLLSRLFPRFLGTSRGMTMDTATISGRDGSRALGFHSRSRACHAHFPENDGLPGIILDRAYAIELSDNDEAQLVHDGNLKAEPAN